MKTVFSNNSETAHVWAQRTHLDGRSQSGNLFFEGGRIYSYGYHYLLGEFISNKSNEVAVIINTDYYSSSTAKHSSLAWGATTHYTQFEKKYTYEDSVIELLKALEAKLLRARKPLMYIEEADAIIYNYMEYIRFRYGEIEISDKVVKAYAPFKLDKGELKALQIKDLERRKREEQRKKEKLKLDIEAFLNYKKDYIYNSEEEFIRISKNGGFIETTKGVRIDIREAKILYNKILKGEDIKGYKIDHYTVIGLNGTLKIGCHNINLENMHVVGKQLI